MIAKSHQKKRENKNALPNTGSNHGYDSLCAYDAVMHMQAIGMPFFIGLVSPDILHRLIYESRIAWFRTSKAAKSRD